jgi:hypothetical protein
MFRAPIRCRGFCTKSPRGKPVESNQSKTSSGGPSPKAAQDDNSKEMHLDELDGWGGWRARLLTQFDREQVLA